MTNTELIAKIKAEIERRNLANYCGTAEQYEEELFAFLDTLEPVTDCHTLEESEKPMNLDFEQELYKRFGMVKDFTLGMRIAQCFYDLGCRRTAEKYDEIEYNRQRAQERQMEKEIPKDLEEAAGEYSFNIPSKLFHLLSEVQQILWKKEIEQAYLAGAKWSAEHLAGVRKMIEQEKKEGRTDCSPQGEVPNDSLATQSYENIPKDLEEAAWDCVLDSVDVNNPVLLPKYKELLTYLFIDGANWQKEQDDYDTIFYKGMMYYRKQMLGEAVEGEIVKDISNRLAVTAKNVNLDGFKFGDKVRVIVIPNTDEK